MASERVADILRATNAPFSAEELLGMSDAQGWAWIHKNRLRPDSDDREQICFIGFDPNEKLSLQELANRACFRVVRGIAKGLDYLCVGDSTNPAEIAQAEAQGAQVISADEFFDLAEAVFPLEMM